MKKIFRMLGLAVSGLLVITLAVIGYILVFLPDVGDAPNLKISVTPERIARGEYLFNHVAGCVSCHAQRDEQLFAMPVKPGTEGAGGEVFDHELGFPGSFTGKNLTPFRLGQWTDGEIFRSIVSGVDKKGHALFPIMPYENYSAVDSEDIYSIITYLRTLKSIPDQWPESRFDFPVNIIVHTLPKKVALPKRQDPSDSVNYGRYLVNMASCKTCHTQADKGKIIESLAFSGGRQMTLPTGGIIRSANITPDLKTGLGSWTRDAFISRFEQYNDSSFHTGHIGKNQFNTIMPWLLFAKMKRTDLASIYSYLRTIKPIENRVLKFTVPR